MTVSMRSKTTSSSWPRFVMRGVEIDLRVGENRGEFLDAGAGAALGDLVGDILGAKVGDHQRKVKDGLVMALKT